MKDIRPTAEEAVERMKAVMKTVIGVSGTPAREIPFAKPNITKDDVEAVASFLEYNDRLTDGDQCREFEDKFSKYIGGGYALATSSCMAALHLAYMVLGIGKGDEVICPAMSHVATAHAIELVGAEPVFIDCNLDGNIDYDKIVNNITRDTKAITLVHFLGIPCDMKNIMEIAKDYDLKVIEDCALALGSKYGGKHVGLHGDISCFSFYPAKHITTGEGGMFVSNNVDYIYEANKLSRFGRVGDPVGKTLYQVNSLGLNYRMDEMSAALGRSQLKRIGKELEIRHKNSLLYRYHLMQKTRIINNNVDYIYEANKLSRFGRVGDPVGKTLYQVIGGGWIRGSYAFCLKLPDKVTREGVRNKLKNNGVETSIYYPHPIPRLTYYRSKYGYRKKDFPMSEYIADRSIALPIGSHISEEDIDYIVGLIKEYIG